MWSNSSNPLKTVYLESLGCPKNQVDAEVILTRFIKAGWTAVSDPEKADLIIVSTCAFIESAVDESIDVILKLSEYKKNGRCKKIIASGSLPERFKKEIIKALPEVDIFLGTALMDDIEKIAKNIDLVQKFW